MFRASKKKDMPVTHSSNLESVIHIVCDELNDDLIGYLAKIGVTNTILAELGLLNSILTFDALKKTNAFGNKPKVIMERSKTFRARFDIDLEEVAKNQKRKSALLKEWQYKIVLKHVLDWIDRKIEDSTTAIAFYTESAGRIVSKRVKLVARKKIEIYNEILDILEDYAGKLPRTERIYDTIDIRLKALARLSDYTPQAFKRRFLKYYATPRAKLIVQVTDTAEFLKKGLLPVWAHTAEQELKVVDKLTKLLIYREKKTEKKANYGKSAISRNGYMIDEFSSLLKDDIGVKVGFGQEWHWKLNCGGSQGGYADFISSPRVNYVNKDDDSLYLQVANRFEEIKKSPRIALSDLVDAPEISQDFLNHIKAIQKRKKNIAWIDEQILGLLVNYFIMHKLKEIISSEIAKGNCDIDILLEIAELFEGVKKQTGKVVLKAKLGLGEVSGPRTKGKESRWIIDHIYVFEIVEEGHPDKGKFILIWMNHKKIHKGNSERIATDLRNHFNLMLARPRAQNGAPLILGRARKLWRKGNFAAMLEKAEKANWKLIQNSYQRGHVANHYGLYCSLDVDEIELSNGKTIYDILVDFQAFQPKGAQDNNVINCGSSPSLIQP